GPPGKVTIRLVNANGLATGAFVTVNCDVAAGVTPTATDFSVTPNVAATTGIFDVNTAALSGVQVTFSAVAGSATQPTSPAVVVSLDTTGTLPAGKLIGAIDITLNLPAGVTVKASPSPIDTATLVPDAGVVVLQGAAATAGSQFLNAS